MRVIDLRAQTTPRTGQKIEERLKRDFHALQPTTARTVARSANQYGLLHSIILKLTRELTESDAAIELLVEQADRERAARTPIVFVGEIEVVRGDGLESAKTRICTEDKSVALHVFRCMGSSGRVVDHVWRFRRCVQQRLLNADEVAQQSEIRTRQ